MEEWKIGYIAGIFDGEGYCSKTKNYLNKKGMQHYHIRIGICMTDEKTMKIIARLLDEVSIKYKWYVTEPKNIKWSTQYRIDISHDNEIEKFEIIFGKYLNRLKIKT